MSTATKEANLSLYQSGNYVAGGAGGRRSPGRGAGCPRKISPFSRAATGGMKGVPEELPRVHCLARFAMASVEER
jgi:hypothetical protein